MKDLNINFEDEDFKKLQNMKEEWKITGKCTNWVDFILNLSKFVEEKE